MMLEPSELQARCRAIRLHKKELAAAIGCHVHTVDNLLSGRGSRAHTANAAAGAIQAEELRLRDYLLERHPLAVSEAAE